MRPHQAPEHARGQMLRAQRTIPAATSPRTIISPKSACRRIEFKGYGLLSALRRIPAISFPEVRSARTATAALGSEMRMVTTGHLEEPNSPGEAYDIIHVHGPLAPGHDLPALEIDETHPDRVEMAQDFFYLSQRIVSPAHVGHNAMLTVQVARVRQRHSGDERLPLPEQERLEAERTEVQKLARFHQLSQL
jgi:hypothetical protein